MAREQVAVVLGDIHVPFQDDAACRVALRIVEMLNPDAVFCNGDWLDCDMISRFDPSPKRRLALHSDIELAKVLFRAVRAVAPNARLYMKEGNHETRLERWRVSHPEVGMLPQLELKALLGFEDIECEYVSPLKRLRWQDWTITHGHLCRKRGGATAQGMIDTYGTSGVSNHVHRLAQVSKRDSVREVTWIENGCLCLLQPEYAEMADWQQGFTVLTWDGQRVWPEVVTIHDGVAFFRGKHVTTNA